MSCCARHSIEVTGEFSKNIGKSLFPFHGFVSFYY